MNLDLVVCIVKHGEGDKCLKFASQKGVQGGTIFFGEGTAQAGILRKLGLDKIKKEIALYVAETKTAQEAMHFIIEKIDFSNKNKGISFRMPLTDALGIVSKQSVQGNDIEINTEPDRNRLEPKERKDMYQAIFVIVNEGEAEQVMDAAQSAGAQGGTVIQGHGAGGYETKKVFNMEIEPEKEMVLIISPLNQTHAITSKINETLELDKPNTGILFVMELSETIGIV